MEERIGTLIVCGFVVLIFYIVALGLIFADLWAGVRKAKQRGEYRTSEGLKKTVGKINKYFAMHFALTLVDAMQISLFYVLYREYCYDIPLLPVFTFVSVLYEAYVEVQSITEPANIKEKKQQDVPYHLFTAMLPEVEFCPDSNDEHDNGIHLPQVSKERSFDLVCRVTLPEVTAYADSTTFMFSSELMVACDEICYNDSKY